MTLDEIIYDVKERINVNSDDRAFDFPEAHIAFVYEESRATVLSQQLNRVGRMVDTELYQTIVVPMEKSSRQFCPSCPSDCKILRSVDKIPNLTYLHNHALVDRVGANDVLSKKYKFIEYNSVDSVFGGTFANKYVYTFVLNGYLYAISKNKLVNTIKTLIMRAVFEQPSKVLDSSLCSDLAGGSCSEYPMKLKYHTYAINMTIQSLAPKYQIPSDVQNDADQNMQQSIVIPQVKQKKKNAS